MLSHKRNEEVMSSCAKQSGVHVLQFSALKLSHSTPNTYSSLGVAAMHNKHFAHTKEKKNRKSKVYSLSTGRSMTKKNILAKEILGPEVKRALLFFEVQTDCMHIIQQNILVEPCQLWLNCTPECMQMCVERSLIQLVQKK